MVGCELVVYKSSRKQLVLAQDYLQVIITGTNSKKEVISIQSLLNYFQILLHLALVGE